MNGLMINAIILARSHSTEQCPPGPRHCFRCFAPQAYLVSFFFILLLNLQAEVVVLKADPLNRLTNAAYSDGSRESYSYDGAGNRLSRVTLAATTPIDSTSPSVPTNLISLAFTPSQLFVGWNRSYDTGGSGLAGYQVYVNNTLAATTTSTNFLLGLVPGAEYCVAIAAYDRAKNISGLSPTLCFATAATNDSLPPILSIASLTNGSVVLTNSVLISGTATDSTRGNNGIATVTANGQPASGAVTSLNSTSEWSVLVSLTPGYNPIRTVASDASAVLNRTTNELMLIRAMASNEPPAVTASRVSSNGRIETTLVGYIGSTYGVWASSDLVNWTQVTNVTLTNWVQELGHFEADSSPHRFYRFSIATFGVSPAPGLLLKRSGLPITTQPFAVGDNGYLLGTTPLGVFAIDSTSLTQKWGTVKPIGCSGFPSVPVSVSSGGIVFGVGDWNQCGNGRLVTFTLSDGFVLLEYGGQGPHPRHVAALDENSNTLYHGVAPFLAYNYVSHSESWSAFIGYDIGGKGIAIDAAHNIFVGSYNGGGNLVSLTPGGALRWSMPFLNNDGPIILGVVGTNTLLVDNNGIFEARDAGTGAVSWQVAGLDNPVADISGNLYCNTISSSEIVSYDLAGNERWRTALQDAAKVCVDFIDVNEIVYAHATNRLFAFSAPSGQLLWTFFADAAIGTPPVLGYGGRIVLSDTLGNYYLLNSATTYAPSSWPVARYANRRHTAKANDVLAQPGLP
jgi:YD repeat-containing protein